MIKNILDELANESGRKAKQQILASHSTNNVLKRVFKLALDPTHNFYVKQIPPFDHVQSVTTLDDGLSWIVDNLSTRAVTGDTARKQLAELLSTMSPDDAEVLCRVIKRDLRCGTSSATANSVWRALIPEYPYMRCLSEDAVVDTVDGPMTIQHIVDNEVQTSVVTVDVDGTLTSKPIIGWFDNGHADDNWYTITYEEDGVIHTSHPFTGNHIVFTNDNVERSVDSLTPGMCLR